MTILTPPGWLQNAGTTHTAAQLRIYLAALQAGMSGGATSLRSRGGVHPGLGQEFLVTQTASPSMGVLVESGVISIPGSLSSTQGNYFASNDAQVTLSISAAHATLPRIDIVVVNVRDSFYSGANNDVQLQVVTGTPASSPVAPTAPDNSLTIAQVAVGAAVTSIVNGNITDTRIYMAAAGGVINARNDAARPASTEIVEGQPVWTMDNNKLWVFDGTDYAQVFPGGLVKINESVLTSTAASITFSSIPQIYRSLLLHVYGRFDAATSFVSVRLRFNGDSTAIYDSQQITANNTTVQGFESLNATGADIGEIAAATATAGAPGMMSVTIPAYSGSTFWKTTVSNHNLSVLGGSTGGMHTKQWISKWRNTAAITSINIYSPTAGNFIAGSHFMLYGYL